MKNKIYILVGLLVLGNVAFFALWQRDEHLIVNAKVQITAANTKSWEIYNKNREQLLELKKEHSVIFQGLNIPPYVKPPEPLN